MKMSLSYHAPLTTTDLFYLHALSVYPLVRHYGLAPVFYATAFLFSTPCHLIPLDTRSWAPAYVDLLLAWFLLDFPTSDHLDILSATLQCATCDCASFRLLV